ncbi:MAG: amino acid ABC transporter substrate-binding protein [Desulfobacteraceae bacterium]|nr:amino acid ABC transporter substrate-binding protein [Desulfobacteraceae bacterium]
MKDAKNDRRLCGVLGFNYVNFGQKNADVDMGCMNYDCLVQKALNLRCDISFVRYEILAGWGDVLNKRYVENDKLVFLPVPGVPLESFHLMISKKWKYAEAFKTYFNNAIGELRESGELKKLLDKHVKKGP